MSSFESHASAEFWARYHQLAVEVQRAADKQFDLFQRDPSHPSLRLKPVGELWSVRVTDAFRALAVRDGNNFYWFWIGPHDEYMRLIGA
jgi:hypothetical protein